MQPDTIDGKAVKNLASAHALNGAVVFGHGQLRGLGRVLDGLQPRKPLWRQVCRAAAQQQHKDNQQRQSPCGQQNNGVESQDIYYCFDSLKGL